MNIIGNVVLFNFLNMTAYEVEDTTLGNPRFGYLVFYLNFGWN